MKTIYYYGIDNNRGGMENYALNLIKGITSKTDEIKFHIISQYEDFAFKDELVNECKCKYTVIPNWKKHPFKYCSAIKEILKEASKNDLCQINLMSYRNFLLLHSVKKSKIKTLIVGHATNTNNIFNKIVHKFFRFIYKRFGIKIANNETVAKYLYGSIKDCKYIELGINPEKFKFNQEKRVEIRNKLNINDSTFVIGQVGRICKAKNQIFSCKIMKKLKEENIHLFLFGKYTDTHLQKYCFKNNLSNIHFVGEISNINEIYNALDLFIFPSLFESAGFALYEAMANNCPSLVSTNVPTKNLCLENVEVLNLNVDSWVNKILEIKNTHYREYKKREVPSLEKQNNEYLNFYLNL